jgi:putative transposase
MNQPEDGSAGASPSNKPKLPQRNHPAHRLLETAFAPTLLFLTVCTKDRKPWLATPEAHRILREIWSNARAWLVGRYVIMPDHLHLFAVPGDNALPLERWVRYWKSQFSKSAKKPEWQWQTDHWDRQLRTGESYAEKWDYVRLNPVRHGLVASADEWPYQGELNELRWD